MLKCFLLDGISWYVSKITTFGLWESPQVEQKTVKMGWILLYPAVLSQYKLRSGIFVWDWRNFLTYFLDEVASLEELLFLTFNILFF